MYRVLFKNEYYKSVSDGSNRIITVLLDVNKFYGIDLTESKFIYNSLGFRKTEFTQEALTQIHEYCVKEKIREEYLQLELQNRIMNHLMGYIL